MRNDRISLLLLPMAFGAMVCHDATAQLQPTAIDWSTVPEATLPEKIAAACEELRVSLAAGPCLVVEIQPKVDLDPRWRIGGHVQWLLGEALSSIGVECVDGREWRRLLATRVQRGTQDLPAVRWSRSTVTRAAEVTRAKLVLVGTFTGSRSRARLELAVFDGLSGERLSAVSVDIPRAESTVEANTPLANRKLLEWAEERLGTRVEDGECTSLAREGLGAVGARLPREPYDWGQKLPPGTPPLPGDVLQFEEANLGGAITVKHHTAIVYEIHEPGQVTVIHQNWNDGNGPARSVKFSMFSHLDDVRSGQLLIYRPLGAGDR